MITDEDRARLGDLAMRAIDSILEQYGATATLEDAVLVYEVALRDGEDIWTELNAETTTHRSTVAGGIAAAYAETQLRPWDRTDDEDD